MNDVVDQVRELSEGAHRVAGAGVASLSGPELCQVAVDARRLRELADHLEVHALGALDETGYTDTTFGMLTANWFGRHTAMSPSVGRAQITVARRLARDLHGTDQAWLDGRITREHVRVLVDAANPRIRDHIATLEDDLIGLVETQTSFTSWRRRISEVVTRLDHDGPEPDDPTNTSASWSRSGAFAELRARFGGASVETIEQILEAKTDELFRQQARDRKLTTDLPELTRNQLRGHALVELLTQALAIDQHTTRGPRTAVTLVIRTDQPALGPAAYVAAAGPAATDPLWSLTNPNGDHLLADHFGALLCDCDVHELVVDADGNPLDMGRTIRWASAKQRLAVLIRDGGCAMPGCDCPVGWLDIHHLITWDDGGPTDIDNLVALCRRHHGVAHRNGWSLTWCDGWLLWTTPTGDSFWAQRHGQQRAGPAPPAMAA